MAKIRLTRPERQKLAQSDGSGRRAAGLEHGDENSEPTIGDTAQGAAVWPAWRSRA